MDTRKRTTRIFTVEPKPKTHRLKYWLSNLLDSTVFNLCLILLITTSVALIFVEYMLPQGPELQRIIFVNGIITSLFALELSIRFLLAPNKKIYFSNYWIDILSVVPELRIFRTFRIIRVLRLLRFSRTSVLLLRRTGISDHLAQSIANFGTLLVTTILMVFCGTLTLLLFEVHHSETIPVGVFAEKAWENAFLFLSGELLSGLPYTVGGKVVSLLISLSGLVTFAVLVGMVSASLTTYLTTKMDRKELSLDDLQGHIIICGWERIGATILKELEANHEIWRNGIVVIAETDINIAAEAKLKKTSTFFHINADFTSVENIEAAGVKRARTAIVLADKGKTEGLGDQDRDARTVLVCLTLEKLNPQLFTVAELLNDQNADHLRMAGVEEILSRTGVTGGLLAASAVNQGLMNLVEHLISRRSGTIVKKIKTPNEFVGRPILEVMTFLKKEHNATLLSLDRCETGETYEQLVNPPSDLIVDRRDLLTLLLKSDSELAKLAL